MTENIWVLADRVAGFEVTSREFHNEITSLRTLFGGLGFLAFQLERLEELARASPYGDVIVGFFSDLVGDTGLPEGSNELVPCFYHWYGVTVVNFVRKVGLLHGISEGALPTPPFTGRNELRIVKDYCGRYVKSATEIAPALKWRNKVFAHFASTDPIGDDYEALLQQVAFYPVSYKMGKLTVGSWQFVTGPPGPDGGLPEGRASGLPEWAMTDLHASFVRRYELSVRVG
ncbi:MAG TPA: hypothetical protein VHM92_13450 [Allosphingosinicella sp.]|nr:hypothetical protein [Allosphingosinicella sp.]